LFLLITTVTQGDNDIGYGLQFFCQRFREKIYHMQLSQMGTKMTLNTQQLVNNQYKYYNPPITVLWFHIQL